MIAGLGGRGARRPGVLILGALVILVLAGGIVWWVARPRPVAPGACPGALNSAGANLLPNSAFAPGVVSGTLVAGWDISGRLQPGTPPGWIGPAAGTDLKAARFRATPGAHYCYAVATGGSGHVQVLIRWQTATLKNRIADTALAPQPAGQSLAGDAVAPPGAVYGGLWLRAIDGAPMFHAPQLTPAGVQVLPWPAGARGALAFSFDWETAMGGLIHSKSQHDREYAVKRGLAMRSGADILLQLFQAHGIQATFYATGYNLLDGNPQRRQFAGDPTYKWAAPQGWHTTWWLSHPWYSDDPYGTLASDPAWYFGDQADKLSQAGQEIGSHTFGHLYVRGTKPISLSVDLDAWTAAAAARHLPPVRSFAFPWQSSNSLDARFYQVLADHGVDSVTRLYPRDLQDHYLISAADVYSPMLIMPDLLLGPAGPDTVESGTTDVQGEGAAQAIIGETIARGGVVSFWNHPEQLTIPNVQDAWRATVTAAAAARDRGDLWIAPVSTIVHRWRDTGQVEVTTTASNGHLSITLINHSPDLLDGLTLALPQPAGAVRIGGVPIPPGRPAQVVVPHLAPTTPLQIDVDLPPGAASP
ncbi:MAG TPA: polysaccharide deacetylase family protein [Chloroflexia bacterium]|nr:polysaccharide deacetylase family protein [Chloroflexia bacterium]